MNPRCTRGSMSEIMLVTVYPDPCGRHKPAQGSQGRLCARPCEVGVVPGQESQVHRARTQAAGACAGHVCAQLRVLAGGTPRAPLAPAERAALFLRRGRPRGLPAGSGLGRLRPGRPGLAAGGRSATPSPAGGAGSAPVTGAGGWGWGGGRQAIHLLLLQRNGAARAPAHLSSASFADNRHLSSLSSANVISAADSGRGHRRMGLLDTRSCIYTLALETWGGHMGPGGAHVSVCMWISTP